MIPFSNTLSLRFFFNVRDDVSQPLMDEKIKDRVTVEFNKINESEVHWSWEEI